MANILVCAVSNVNWTQQKYVDSFVEGLMNELARFGNNVKSIRINDFYVRNIPLIKEKELAENLKAFNPDLIITFNNAFPYPGILEDLDCPVACYMADSCSFMVNKDLMEKYADRYYYFNFSQDTIKPFFHWFPFVPKDRVILLGHYTALRAVDMEQDINISFVGTVATWVTYFPDYFKNFFNTTKGSDKKKSQEINAIKDEFFESLDDFRKNSLERFECGLPGHSVGPFSPEQAAILTLTSNMRFHILNNLTDLGLKIFGPPIVYANMIPYSVDMFRAYDFTPHVTMEHATHNYNRSKISMNLPHVHATEGLSWRVCDILASNAVLLSNKQSDLQNLMKGYAELPMYESPAEARNIAQKLLADDAWRRDLTAAANQMIDDKCRFKKAFNIIQEVTGVKLVTENAENVETGMIEYLDERPFNRPIVSRAYKLYKSSRIIPPIHLYTAEKYQNIKKSMKR